MPNIAARVRNTFAKERPSSALTDDSTTSTDRDEPSAPVSMIESSMFSASSSSSTMLGGFDGPIVGIAGGGRVLVDDDELLRRAQLVQCEMNFDELTDLSKCHWKWKDSKSDFTLFTREVSKPSSAPLSSVTGVAQEVLAAGEVHCSLEELAHILRSSTEVEYNAVMTGLYKKDFIYGSVVHVAPTLVKSPEDPSASDALLSVKTSAFVRSNIFVRNEQWCFLEYFQHHTSRDAFTVTLASLPESEVVAGKAKHGRVDQLHDLVAGYSVARIPGTKSVRVLFHGSFSGDNVVAKGHASASMSKARLVALAKGVNRLQDVVRRRRLGVQRLANRSAFAAKNSRCICCTKSLHLLSKKKRCYVCGYYVCDKDWSVQKAETRHGQVTPIRVCGRCLESVENCDFADVSPRDLGAVAVQPDRESADKAGAALATFLQDALRNSSELKKESVRAVIKHLVNEEQRVSEDSADVPVVALNDSSDDSTYISALDRYFQVPAMPLERCVLANNEQRAYPLEPVEDPTTMVPDFPVPANEAQRLSTIEKANLMNMSNADELNIICTLAARELNCMAGLVTIVGQDSQVVLASNLEPFRMLSMPRNQSFCQHAVMDSKPLLVPHPEADVRFGNLPSLKENNIKFYCGFPIVDSSNAVLGTVCCVDTKSHDLTQAQYATMVRLAETAAKVVRIKSREGGVSPPGPAAPVDV